MNPQNNQIDIPAFIKILNDLFDAKYGCLRGCSFLTIEEYDELKKWCINSGFFLFQVTHFQIFCPKT